MSYTCHSGGCKGADMAWETIGEEYGVKTIAYSFEGHTQYGKNRQILSVEELSEGYEHVLEANKVMKRNPQYQPRYIKGLLCRNWFQVKNSDAIFAIGKFESKTKVSGGTGWAVQMAIDDNRTVYFFDQPTKTWNIFNYETKEFQVCDTPVLTENFAGIGTREINDDGLKAIADVFEKTFQSGGVAQLV